MSEIDLGTDKILNEPVRDVFKRWRRVVDAKHLSGMPFSGFWMGGPEDKTAPVIECFAGELSIAKACIIELDIDQSYKRKGSLVDDLLDLEERILSMGGGRILIIARGFENVVDNESDFRLGRAVHDWDQDILSQTEGSSKWSRFYDRVSDANKHVVYITTIGFSCGDTTYDKAMQSVYSSQFYDGVLELE